MMLNLKHIFSLVLKKKGFWITSNTILSIKFNLGDLIKDENNLQSIKL